MPDTTPNYAFPIPLASEVENISRYQWRDPFNMIDFQIKTEFDDLKNDLNANQSNPNHLYTTAELGLVPNSNWFGITAYAAFRRGYANLLFGISRGTGNLTAPANGDFNGNVLLATFTEPRLDPLMVYGGLVSGHAGCLYHGVVWNRGVYITCTSPNLVINTNEVVYLYGMYPTAIT